MTKSRQIGRQLRKIRDAQKLSQSRFGYKIGVTGKTVSAYETGRCTPPLKVLEKLSRVYDVPIIQLRDVKREYLNDSLNKLKISLDEIKKLLDESLSF